MSAGANIKTRPCSDEGKSSKGEAWFTVTDSIMAACAGGSPKQKDQPVCFMTGIEHCSQGLQPIYEMTKIIIIIKGWCDLQHSDLL